jgi:hypothetical protein
MECLDGYIKTTNISGSCVGCAFINGCEYECDGADYILVRKPKQETMKTPKIHESTHPHHAVWREYTESLLTGKPKQLEYRASVLDFWINASANTSWNVDFEYRIKPTPKLFWYMNGQKIVEFVEPDVIQEQCIVRIHLNGVLICYQTFATRKEA